MSGECERCGWHALDCICHKRCKKCGEYVMKCKCETEVQRLARERDEAVGLLREIVDTFCTQDNKPFSGLQMVSVDTPTREEVKLYITSDMVESIFGKARRWLKWNQCKL